MIFLLLFYKLCVCDRREGVDFVFWDFGGFLLSFQELQMFSSSIQQQKQFVTQRCSVVSMLVNKKSKCLEDKAKNKNVEMGRKSKKNKNTSPIKPKVTPDKRTRKDQNAYQNKNSCYNYTQPIELLKSKDKEGNRTNTKRSVAHQHKSKLLTTSPVLFERSTSNSKKKSNDKSKSRSVSKIHTNRPNYQEKQRDLIKNVTKKLYSQTKEDVKNRSASKSKSKSKTKLQLTDRDISPLKETKRPKEFNVADREISFRKTEPHEYKKAMKKKVKSKMRAQEMYMYPQTDRIDRVDTEVDEPKIKLKKKVPQIKTEFSERRGSYFDDNLLKKLQLGQPEVKNGQACPFVHIKSNFQYKFQNGNAELYSRSEIKTYDEPNWQSQSRSKELQNFKKQQELKWSKMLNGLKNLKNQPQVPQKIDELIRQLNENYSSLQEKASFFLKTNNNKSNESSRKEEETIHFRHLKTNSMEEQPQKQDSRSFLKYISQVPKEKPSKAVLQDQIEVRLEKTVDQATNQRQENRITKLKQNLDESYEQIIDLETRLQKQVPVTRELFTSLKQQQKQLNNSGQRHNGSLRSEKVAEQQEKKTNLISLNTDFYDFFENKKKLKLQLLEKVPFDDASSNQNVPSPQKIPQLSEHKESDKNLLQELNLLQGSSDFVEIVSFRKANRCEFEAQMEQIRQIQSEQFQNMVAIDFGAPFDNQVRIAEQLSSESILLPSYQATGQNNPKLDLLVTEIQTVLIIQFCSNILRNKEILHNFLTTYSELVEANVVNTDFVGNQATGSYQNEHVAEVVNKLFEYLQNQRKDDFMKQISIPFECKPIQILRFLRCVDQEPEFFPEEKDEENQLCIPFFGLQKIEQFQTNVLRNQYYIPNYFSFNHCIYDYFNDVFDELRPFGSKGKAIFSLQLSHPIKSFEEAKKKILGKFEETLSLRYYEETLPEDKYINQEGVFQLTYFNCLDVIEEFFELEALVIYQVLNKHKRGLNFL